MMVSKTESSGNLQMPAFLSGPGGMSERIREFDWSQTPLGAVDGWKKCREDISKLCAAEFQGRL